jgi:hypothetical protein
MCCHVVKSENLIDSFTSHGQTKSVWGQIFVGQSIFGQNSNISETVEGLHKICSCEGYDCLTPFNFFKIKIKK